MGPRQHDQFVTTKQEIEGYVGRTYKYAGDIKWSIEHLEPYTLEQPADPPEDASKTAEFIWKKRVEEWLRRETVLEENLKMVYSLIWGQCTDILRAKLEASVNYPAIKDDYDAIGLLKEIKGITFKFEDQRYLQHSIYFAWRNFYTFRQKEQDTNAQYLEQFNNMVDVLEQYGGTFGMDEALLKDSGLDTTDKDTLHTAYKSAAEYAKKKYLAYVFIIKADNTRYGKLKEDLHNAYTRKQVLYPETITDAYNMLVSYKEFKPRNQSTTSYGVAFAQGNRNNNNSGNNNNRNNNTGNPHSGLTCHGCGEKGHIKPNCPNNKQNQNTANTNVTCLNVGMSTEDLQEVQFNFFNMNYFNTVFHQRDFIRDDLIHWILLDNQSTTDIFCNKALLTNIRATNECTQIFTNGGSITTNMKGTLSQYGDVWYHEEAITNILSLSNVKKKFRITYDSREGDDFIIHKPDGVNLRFTVSPQGLYHHDTRNRQLCMLNTVRGNRENFSQREYDRAVKARDLYGMVGYPSTQDFINMVKFNLLENCDINEKDIQNAEVIFGKDIYALKGKTVRHSPKAVHTTYLEVPEDIFSRYKSVTISADIMYVQGQMFFVTVSRHIKFTTVEFITNRSARTLLTCVLNVK